MSRQLPEPDMAYLRQTLLEMLAIPSPTGFTDTLVRYVAERLDELGVPYELTRRGTVRGTIKGRLNSPDRAVSAHLDTIGASVRDIKDNGRLCLAPVGCWSSRFAEGSRVSLFTDAGVLRGSVLPLMASGHAFNTEVDNLPVSWDHIELRLDTLAASRAEVEALGVSIGDVVAFDPLPEFSESGHLSARHLDDKAGVAALLTALKMVVDSGIEPPIDCHPLFTSTQESAQARRRPCPGMSANLSVWISRRWRQGKAPASTRSPWPCRIPVVPTTITCRAICYAWPKSRRFRYVAIFSATTTATPSRRSPPATISAPRCWPSAATPPTVTSARTVTACRPRPG